MTDLENLEMDNQEEMDLGSLFPTESEETENKPLKEVPNVPEKHFTINAKTLSNVLKVSSLVSSVSDNSFESKILVIKTEGREATFYVQDVKRALELRTPILNTENVFEGTIAISSDTAKKLLKLCDDYFTVIAHENEDGSIRLAVKVWDNEITIDSIKIEVSKYKPMTKPANSVEYDTDDFVKNIKRLHTLASKSVKTARAINIHKNIMYADSLMGLAKIKTHTTYGSYKLPLTDAMILLSLIDFDGEEKFYSNKSGDAYYGNTFSFQTEVYKYQDSDYDILFNRMFDVEGCLINLSQLKKLSNFAYTWESSTGYVGTNYTDAGKIKVTLNTKRVNSVLELSGKENSYVSPLSNDIEIPAYNILLAMSVFTEEEEATMRISNDGVSFENGDIQVVMFSKNAGK